MDPLTLSLIGGAISGGSSSSIGNFNGGSGAVIGGATGSSTGSGSGSTNGGILGIGNVFNIFDSISNLVNCWGSTWQPSRADDFVASNFPIFQADVQNAVNSENPIDAVNQAVRDLRRKYSRDEAWLKRCDNPATGCTAETLRAMTDNLLEGIRQTLQGVSQSLNANVVKTKIEHAFWTDNVSPKCGEIFDNYELQPKPQTIIPNPLSGLTSNSTVKLLGGGLLLPAVLLGTLIYWIFGKKKTNKKKKTQWFKN